ncbi:MAG: hypothetical protein HQK53_06490 [Oligoflexia bacterium]|nr:hypothetical protein [Oligoflexia bacterium]
MRNQTTMALSTPAPSLTLPAQLAIEISSEGELEQVRPLIDFLLQQRPSEFVLELIFSSESVEKAVLELQRRHPRRIRIFRLPLFRPMGALLGWITAKKLILCRYDFYPSLMLYGRRNDVKFILLSATTKNRTSIRNAVGVVNSLINCYWGFIFSSFDKIMAASPLDEKILNSFLSGHVCGRVRGRDREQRKVSFLDLRVLQIADRVSSENLHDLQEGELKPFLQYLLQRFSHEQRLVVGSGWPIEGEIFASADFRRAILRGELQVTIVPHCVHNFSLVNSYDLPLYYLFPGQDFSEQLRLLERRPGVVVVAFRGILCELYTYFADAFVGGGHGRSVHSLLEPYLAGCRVYCGPRIHRSTEYDLIYSLSPQEIQVVENLSDFYRYYTEVRKLPRVSPMATRKYLLTQIRPHFEEFIKECF